MAESTPDLSRGYMELRELEGEWEQFTALQYNKEGELMRILNFELSRIEGDRNFYNVFLTSTDTRLNPSWHMVLEKTVPHSPVRGKMHRGLHDAIGDFFKENLEERPSGVYGRVFVDKTQYASEATKVPEAAGTS